MYTTNISNFVEISQLSRGKKCENTNISYISIIILFLWITSTKFTHHHIKRSHSKVFHIILYKGDKNVPDYVHLSRQNTLLSCFRRYERVLELNI